MASQILLSYLIICGGLLVIHLSVGFMKWLDGVLT